MSTSTKKYTQIEVDKILSQKESKIKEEIKEQRERAIKYPIFNEKGEIEHKYNKGYNQALTTLLSFLEKGK